MFPADNTEKGARQPGALQSALRHDAATTTTTTTAAAATTTNNNNNNNMVLVVRSVVRVDKGQAQLSPHG